MKTLKNVVHACAIAVLMVAAPAYGPVYGQVIEEEDDGYRRSSTADKFFGTAGTVFVNGSSTRASYQSLELGYDTPFAQERGRFYFSGVGTHTNLELDLELNEDGVRQNNVQKNAEGGLPQKVTRELDEGNFEIKDAFVQYNFSDNLQFSTGRRRITWGQFELLSPVNLALPLTPQTTEPITGKINTVVPQDQVSFTWLPSDRVEVQGYYFPTTNIDFLVENVLAEDDMDSVYLKTGTTVDTSPSPQASDQQDLTDHSAFAARVLFYFNWGTLGFTYHDGNDPLVFNRPDLATLELLTDGPTNDPTDDETISRAYNVRRHTDLHEVENYGIELAIPRGKWVYKFEMLYQETTASLNGQSRYFDSVPAAAAGTSANTRLRRAEYEYFEAVLSNKNQFYVPIERQFISIGADSDRDNWRFNASLLTVKESYDSTADQLVKLEEAADFAIERGDPLILPVINVARYLGGNKEKEVGFVFGFIGVYAGTSVYYASRIGENFRWLASLESVSNLRDQLVSESDDPDKPKLDSDDYQLTERMSTGFRVNLIYDF